jgi:hypothetical protein
MGNLVHQHHGVQVRLVKLDPPGSGQPLGNRPGERFETPVVVDDRPPPQQNSWAVRIPIAPPARSEDSTQHRSCGRNIREDHAGVNRPLGRVQAPGGGQGPGIVVF